MNPNILFEPVQLGAIRLPNRDLMAPLTRQRAAADGTPTGLIATHYQQRASAGLIIAEMTVVSPYGRAYLSAPGMYQDSHREGWQRVTTNVHEAGGRIFSQLAHAGRISHPSLLPGNATPIAPSAVRPAGHVYTTSGRQTYVTPHALDAGEIAAVTREFENAARMAKEAGFDGVEVHSANGYLLDQFLRDGTNQRTDGYGGSPEKRVRFLMEVVQALVNVWGAGRVGVRLSPFNPFNDMSDSNPRESFPLFASALSTFGLAYLHVIEPAGAENRLTPRMRESFRGAVVGNDGFDTMAAARAIGSGEAEAISFGVPFLANPDLPARLARNLPLNTPDPATFYGGDARGYIDYPAYSQAA
jgi:N-ethylmaleimide reductase